MKTDQINYRRDMIIITIVMIATAFLVLGSSILPITQYSQNTAATPKTPRPTATPLPEPTVTPIVISIPQLEQQDEGIWDFLSSNGGWIVAIIALTYTIVQERQQRFRENEQRIYAELTEWAGDSFQVLMRLAQQPQGGPFDDECSEAYLRWNGRIGYIRAQAKTFKNGERLVNIIKSISGEIPRAYNNALNLEETYENRLAIIVQAQQYCEALLTAIAEHE
jgi:hypothetical protein